MVYRPGIDPAPQETATYGSPTQASLDRGELADLPELPIDVRAARAWHRAMVNRGTARNDYASNLRSYVRFAVEENNLPEARARLAALLAYADFTHVTYFTSQDISVSTGGGVTELPTWSVYREEYLPRDLDNPIDGSEVHISTHPTEAEADAEANRLYEQRN